jgi:hypothetical protein
MNFEKKATQLEIIGCFGILLNSTLLNNFAKICLISLKHFLNLLLDRDKNPRENSSYVTNCIY